MDAAGDYMTPDAEGTFHVLAASTSDSRWKATVPIQVRWRGIRVRIAPSATTLSTGDSTTFTAVVRGTRRWQSTAVTWAVEEGAKGGSIDASGNYTAPDATGIFHVVASSVADPSKNATATVTVSADQGVSVAIVPKNASTRAKGKLTLQGHGDGRPERPERRRDLVNPGGGERRQRGRLGELHRSGELGHRARGGHEHRRPLEDRGGDGRRHRRALGGGLDSLPSTASVVAGDETSFSAMVTGTDAGQSTDVTWSVQEGAAGGSIDASGRYTAPGNPGTFHVVATSVADTSKSAQATVTVTAAPNITVSIAPSSASTPAGGTLSFTASVTGLGSGQSSAVSWSVQEGATGGTINGAGTYTAPSTPGTFHVIATSVADNTEFASGTVTVTAQSAPPPPPPPSSGLLPADRMTVWNPGVSGGIPARTTVCRTVDPPGGDATSTIQAAIDACPAGQVVQLSAGTFTINGGNFVLINKGVTLRGAGPGQTTLQKTDGATPGSYIPGPNPSPIVIVGPARWANGGGTSTNLTSDGVKGANSVTVASSVGFSAGQFVLLDELSNASWQTDPGGRGQIWASPDFRVVWQRHNPPQPTDDPFPDAAGWFSRQDRPTNEIKQIDHVSGNTVYFTTPIHISYRAAQTAQLTSFGYDLRPERRHRGPESHRGRQRQHPLQLGRQLLGEEHRQHRLAQRGICSCEHLPRGGPRLLRPRRRLAGPGRRRLRHQPLRRRRRGPGGELHHRQGQQGDGGPLAQGRLGVRLQLHRRRLHPRATPAGSRSGSTPHTWWARTTCCSRGTTASTSTRTRPTATPSTTPSSATILRRRPRDFDDAERDNGPRRCAGAAFYSYWHGFIGNVIGAAGQMSGWVYESRQTWTAGRSPSSAGTTGTASRRIKGAATTIRHGNFDYVTNSVKWDRASSPRVSRSSLYLGGKPAFFEQAAYTWPWVDPTGATKLYTLPAKAALRQRDTVRPAVS